MKGDSSFVRLSCLKIRNFKNVEYGEVSLGRSRKSDADILGLYGQNGSGKTALIDVLDLLSYLLCGRKIPSRFSDCIRVGSQSAEIEYHFNAELNDVAYRIQYIVEIVSASDESASSNTLDSPDQKQHGRLSVRREHLKASYTDGEGGNGKLQTVIDTDTDSVFVPDSKYQLLTGLSRKNSTDLLVAKKVSERESRSFVFSPELLKAFRENSSGRGYAEYNYLHDMIERLVQYGNAELSVINTANAGLISLDFLPVAFSYENEAAGKIFGNTAIMIGGTTVVPEPVFQYISLIIDSMNIVLQQIIPGLTISIRDYGIQTMNDGHDGRRIELMSCRGSTEIPLQYESEGIKKIISILQLLIVVYNRKSITVAVDELDSGIFEYLLGEILKIIAEQGKGQLIFTSHNLRPLETLDKDSIVFTTVNPSNRYVRMTYVMANNNLRDIYYRDISLGGTQKETLYDFTDNARIGLAFRKAGDGCTT